MFITLTFNFSLSFPLPAADELERVERAEKIESMVVDELSADIAKAKMSISVVIKYPDDSHAPVAAAGADKAEAQAKQDAK